MTMVSFCALCRTGQVDMWAVKLRRIRQIITRTKYGEIIGPALIINLGTQIMDAVCRPHTRHNATHTFSNTPTIMVMRTIYFFLAPRLISGFGFFLTEVWATPCLRNCTRASAADAARTSPLDLRPLRSVPLQMNKVFSAVISSLT